MFFLFFFVVQPFTIDGFKFDLRVYVAVTSCDPFRVFVYKEGLARFTTQHYEEPTQTNCVRTKILCFAFLRIKILKFI